MHGRAALATHCSSAPPGGPEPVGQARTQGWDVCEAGSPAHSWGAVLQGPWVHTLAVPGSSLLTCYGIISPALLIAGRLFSGGPSYALGWCQHPWSPPTRSSVTTRDVLRHCLAASPGYNVTERIWTQGLSPILACPEVVTWPRGLVLVDGE